MDGERVDAGDSGGTVVGECGGLGCAWVMWVSIEKEENEREKERERFYEIKKRESADRE